MQICRYFLILFSLILTTGEAWTKDTPRQNQPDDTKLLILGLKIDYLTLDDVIPAYRFDTEYYLPLSILSQILDIAIKVNLGTATADGFIIKEDRQFHLDLARREVILNGERLSFSERDVLLYPDDIYVNSSQLEKWWPMTFELNLFTSQVLIKSLEPLPFQKKLLREKEIEKMRRRYKGSDKNYSPLESQYRLISPPFIDQRISAHYQKTPEGNKQQTYNYTTHVKTDMLYHETSLYINGGSEEENEDIHFVASRSDPDGEMLGFMGATHYSFVHISTPGINYISVNKAGVPGVKISNYPLKQQTHFDKHTFEGELLPDWEVELYHNNALIAYQDKPINGRYNFPDIPLLFGHNYFKLIFYGPHGEVREESNTFSLTGELVRPGSYYYELVVAEEEGSNSKRSLIRQDIGLNKYLSAQINFVSVPVSDNSAFDNSEDQHNYANIALNGFWSSLFYRYSYISEIDGGDVNELSLQNRIGRTNLSASIAKFDDFESEQLQSTDPLIQRTQYRIDTIIPPWLLPQMPVSLEVINDEHESGNIRTEYIGRISAATRGLAVTNTLSRVESTISDTAENGILQISTHTHNFALRTELYYQNKPESKLNSITLNFSGRYFHPYQFNFGVTKFSSDEYQYLLGLNKQFGNYSLLTTTTYKTSGERAINLAFAISFGHDPRLNRWHTQAAPLAVNGSASILVFFDKNQNGIQDEGEEGLPNIGFRFNDSIKQKRTDQDGVVLFTDLPTHQAMDLGIDIATLEDPLMVPLKPGVQVTSRPGHIDQINFPVILTGEIDGIVYLHKNGKNIPVGDVEIELHDISGKLIQKMKSAYDGFYVLSKIPAGKYLILISPEQAAKHGLHGVLPREITIQAENPFITGINFILFLNDKKKPRPQKNIAE